jgi:hypothetical protein
MEGLQISARVHNGDAHFGLRFLGGLACCQNDVLSIVDRHVHGLILFLSWADCSGYGRVDSNGDYASGINMSKPQISPACVAGW